MKLKEMNTAKSKKLKRALKENFGFSTNTIEKFSPSATQKFHSKVKECLKETRQIRAKSIEANKTHMKLVMLEQFLNEMTNQKRLVKESEEVQRSQIILAAQDFVDQIQKTLETVSKLKISELPAVVSGISGEFGNDKAKQYRQKADGALTELIQTLTETHSALESALGVITGDESIDDMDSMGDEMPGVDDEQMDDMDDMDDIGEPDEAMPELDDDEMMAGRARRPS
jgi:hypothetical protein